LPASRPAASWPLSGGLCTCTDCQNFVFFFSSRRRHTRSKRDWSSDVCSSDLPIKANYMDIIRSIFYIKHIHCLIIINMILYYLQRMKEGRFFMTNEQHNKKKLTTASGMPVADNKNSKTAGPRGPLLMEDFWLMEKLAHLNREVIPERRMHAKGSGAFGTFTVTNDITKYTKAKIFSEVGKKTDMFARFSTVAGERGAADHERD